MDLIALFVCLIVATIPRTDNEVCWLQFRQSADAIPEVQCQGEHQANSFTSSVTYLIIKYPQDKWMPHSLCQLCPECLR